MDTKTICFDESCDSSSNNKLMMGSPRKFESFLQNIKNLERELIDTFNEFDALTHVEVESSIYSEKNPSTELLKVLQKVGLNYEDYIKTMNDLENDKESEDDQINMELDKHILEETTDRSKKPYKKDVLEVTRNTLSVQPSIESDSASTVVNSRSSIEIVHQQIDKEIKYKKANENQFDNSVSPDKSADFNSEEEYIKDRLQELENEMKSEQERLKRIQQIKNESFMLTSNDQFPRWRSLLNIEQTSLITRYLHDEYKRRPQSAIEQHSNFGKVCDRNKLLERNLVYYYFTLPDEERSCCFPFLDSHLQKKVETVSANLENNLVCKIEEIGKLPAVETPVNATKFVVEDDEASYLGTSSFLTLANEIGSVSHVSPSALSDLEELGVVSITNEYSTAVATDSLIFQNVNDETDSRLAVEVPDSHNVTTERADEREAPLDPSTETTVELVGVNDLTYKLPSRTSCATKILQENSNDDSDLVSETVASGLENCNSNFLRLNNSPQIVQNGKLIQTTNLMQSISEQIHNLNSHNTNVATETSVVTNEAICLNLFNVKFEGTNFSSISKYFKFLKFLIINECDLKSNDLKAIIQLDNLEFLDASRNHLNTVNLSEMNLSKLTILKLAHNKLTKLSDIMGLFPNLLILDISSNYITTLDIQKLIISFPKLYQLSASSNLITCVQLKSSETKRINENLNMLDLSDNEITAIDKDLISVTNVTHLKLSSNTLNKPFETGIFGVLLQELILDRNNLTSINWLSESWLPNLIFLNVSHNRISKLPILPFPLLQKLIISHNLIHETESVIKGTNFLPRNCVLDIQSNPCTLNLSFLETIRKEFPNTIITSHQDNESTISIMKNHELQTIIFNKSICQCSQCNSLRISCEQYYKEYKECANCLDKTFECINVEVKNQELMCLDNPITHSHISCHLNSNNSLHLENQLIQFNDQKILFNVFSKENQCSLMYQYVNLVGKISDLKRKQDTLLKLYFNEINNKVSIKDTKNDFQYKFLTKEFIHHFLMHTNL
ncbi:unnamed protein product [Schistosoma turkestanicum]|nr:unnamed protein product [Schistosoma turkestanicum]